MSIMRREREGIATHGTMFVLVREPSESSTEVTTDVRVMCVEWWAVACHAQPRKESPR